MTEGSFVAVGLGPGTPETLTLEALDVLREAREVYVQAVDHPALAAVRARLPQVAFHGLGLRGSATVTVAETQCTVADAVVELARRPGGVIFAVPGSPVVDAVVRMVLDSLGDAVPVRLVQGLSPLEPVLAAAGALAPAWLTVIDAAEVSLLGREDAVGAVEGIERRLPWQAPTPTASLIVTNLNTQEQAAAAQRWLRHYYPDAHTVCLVRAPGTPGCTVQEVSLDALGGLQDLTRFAALYVPPVPEIANLRTFAGLMNVTRTLRAPGGCPWDREQTHASLKPHLLEEAYEVIDALDRGDAAAICEEMGDLLLQITLHSQVAAEAGEFSIEDVIQGITGKMVGRHPHVFGDLELESAQDVRQAWESFKQREKPRRASVLEQIPEALPALPRSNSIQKRVTSVGFTWPGLDDVIAKVDEELGELRCEVSAGAPRETQREELGDILFALVGLARHLKLDPEEALRLANRKFTARFQYVESRASAQGKALRDLRSEELNELWQEAKALGIGAPHQ